MLNNCSKLTLARYMPNGTLDATFGSNGLVVGPTGLRAGAEGSPLQPAADTSQSKLVMTACTPVGCRSWPRFLPNGALDASFDGDGVSDTVPGGGGAVQVDSEGRVVVGGSRINRFLLLRYAESGALDPSFGDGGVVTTSFGPDFSGVQELLAQPDGKLVAAGTAEPGSPWPATLVAPSTDVADVSLTVTDSPDPVASGGRVTTRRR